MTDPGTMRQLASSFEQSSEAYAAHRPVYPRDAVCWLAGTDPRNVLDLGAGGGSLTAALVDLGHRVVAAEPSASMLDVLATRGEASAVRSRGEALPFAAGSFDAVAVATAFHWFDAAQALPQIATVLRPGGRLALVWSTRQESDGWTRAFGDLLREVQPEALVGDWGTGSVSRVEESPLFDQLETAVFGFEQRLGRRGLIGLTASRSYVVALPAERRRRLSRDIGRLFDEVADADPPDEHPADDYPADEQLPVRQPTVRLPYLAECWRCSVKDPPSGGSLSARTVASAT